MHPIPLRSSELAKRLAAEEVALLFPDLSHRKVLDITAALYFYDHWTHLLASTNPDAASLPFDQDIAYNALMLRRVKQAQHVERTCSIPFPYAFWLVIETSVTRDLRRDFVPYEFLHDDDPFLRELATLDWWRVVSSEAGHPLVPAGFMLCHATHAGHHSRYVPPGPGTDAVGMRWLDIILPDTAFNHPWRRLSHSIYLRREEMCEIEPIPLAEMLDSSYRPLKPDIAILREPGGRRNRKDWPARIERSKKQYRRLAAAAGLPDAVARQATEAFSIDVRKVLGEPWYWPLEPRGSNAALAMFGHAATGAEVANAERNTKPGARAR